MPRGNVGGRPRERRICGEIAGKGGIRKHGMQKKKKKSIAARVAATGAREVCAGVSRCLRGDTGIAAGPETMALTEVGSLSFFAVTLPCPRIASRAC